MERSATVRRTSYKTYKTKTEVQAKGALSGTNLPMTRAPFGLIFLIYIAPLLFL